MGQAHPKNQITDKKQLSNAITTIGVFCNSSVSKVAFNTSCHEAAADFLGRIGLRSLDRLTWPQK